MSDKEFKIDEKDFEIMRHLRNDGRKSFTDIAAEMNSSVGMVRNRYNELVEKKILAVEGWVAPSKRGLMSFARVSISVKPANKINAVTEKLKSVTNVCFIAVSSGKYSIDISLLSESNQKLFQILNDEIHSIDGVEETDVTMYFNILKWGKRVTDKIIPGKSK
ncbi:MAG: Lrp/AsnC family transcriptional regulator [Flavobacteriales bacterium]|nr:Lrp/AsnC family transcriptional regulator [Flavobacteriales bacterium]